MIKIVTDTYVKLGVNIRLLNKKKITFLLVLILLFTVILYKNYTAHKSIKILITQVGDLYKKNNELTIANQNLNSTISSLEKGSNSQNDWENKRAAAIGDSITSFGKYVQLTQKALNLSEFDNFAIGGRPLADGTKNGEGLVSTSLTHNYRKYDLITIFVGTNDFKLDVPIGEIGIKNQTEFNSQLFFGAYRKLLDFILESNPSTNILLITPIQRDNDGYDIDKRNLSGFSLGDYRTAIEELGKMYSLPVLDLYSTSGINSFTLDYFTKDGLHPNVIGDQVIADKLILYIRNNLSPR